MSLVSISVDRCLFGVETGGSGQPVRSGLVTLLGVVKVREIHSIVDTDSMTYMPDWEPVPKCRREQMGRWLPIGWAEFGESSIVTPSNGSAGRTELNTSLGRHVVAQDGLSELNRVRDYRNRRFSHGIETLGKILSNNGSHMSIRPDEDAQGWMVRLTSRLRTLPGTTMVKNCSAGAGRTLWTT